MKIIFRKKVSDLPKHSSRAFAILRNTWINYKDALSHDTSSLWVAHVIVLSSFRATYLANAVAKWNYARETLLQRAASEPGVAIY